MKRHCDIYTGDLFAVPQPAPATPGGLAYGQELRVLLARSLSQANKDAGLSREDVAARMAGLVGESISRHQIDAWTAESRPAWRFPLEYAAAFEVACGTTGLQELLASKRGARVYSGADVVRAELGRIESEQLRLRRQKDSLRRYLNTHQ